MIRVSSPQGWVVSRLFRSRRVRYFCKPKAHHYTASNGSRSLATVCARAAADSPGNLGGYRSDYPAPLLGCMADIQRSATEDVGGSEVESHATRVGLRAALGRATPPVTAASWTGESSQAALRPPSWRLLSACPPQNAIHENRNSELFWLADLPNPS